MWRTGMVSGIAGLAALAMLALVATPAPPPPVPSVLPAAEAQAARRAPRRTLVLHGASAAGDPARPGASALPPQLGIAVSPGAGEFAHTWLLPALSARGVQVDTHRESDRGAVTRVDRGFDDVALVIGRSEASESWRGLATQPVGRLAVVAVVRERRPLENLPEHWLRDVLIGNATLWSHIGGGAADPIRVLVQHHTPPDGEVAQRLLQGDRLAVTDDPQPFAEVCDAVIADDAVLGLVTLIEGRTLPAGVRAVRVDYLAPTEERYPLALPVRVVGRNHTLVDAIAAIVRARMSPR